MKHFIFILLFFLVDPVMADSYTPPKMEVSIATDMTSYEAWKSGEKIYHIAPQERGIEGRIQSLITTERVLGK